MHAHYTIKGMVWHHAKEVAKWKIAYILKEVITERIIDDITLYIRTQNNAGI